MSENFGFEKIEREQADQDENITSTSLTEDVGEEAPEEDMFRDDFPQKGANLLDDSMSGGGDMFNNEATPSEPLINFGSPASETTPSAPQMNDLPTESAPVSTKSSACQEEGLMGVPGMSALCCWMKTVDPRDDIDRTSLKSDMDETSPSNSQSTSLPDSAESLTGPFHGGGADKGNLPVDTNKHFDKDSDSSSLVSSSDNDYSSSADESDSESGNEISDGDNPVASETFDEVDAGKLATELQESCDTISGIDSPVASEILNQAEELETSEPEKQNQQNIHSAGLEFDELEMEKNEENVNDELDSVKPESQIQQKIDSSGLEFDELKLEITKENTNNELEIVKPESLDQQNIDSPEPDLDDSKTEIDKENVCEEPEIPEKKNIDSPRLDYEQLNMDINKDDTSGDSPGTVEGQVQQDVDAVEENNGIETMEKELAGGAECEPESTENVVSDAPVAGLSETDMLDVIERLTKEDNSQVESCSSELVDNMNDNQAVRDDEYERFLRGEEVLSVDNTSPVVSDNDSLENDSGSQDSGGSDSDINSCSDSDVSGDEDGIGNWSPSPLYAGGLGSVTETGELDEEDDEAMDVEESGVLAGYEYEGDSGVVSNQDNELNTLRADVKGLMEEMEAIVKENDGVKDKRASQTFVEELLEEMDKTENVPEVSKGNEHIVSIMSSGSRDRSRTPDHVKFQSPTNILFYDPDCPIVERVSAEIADELIDHDQVYSNQQTPEMNTVDLESNPMQENEPEDLGAAVVKDLKDVYNNLEAKGEIDSPTTDNKTIDDIASEFSNEVLAEATKETLESMKDPVDSYDKEEPLVLDSFYKKKPSGESGTKPAADRDNQDDEPAEISDDVMVTESSSRVECVPSENIGASSLPQNNNDIESEKEMKSQLLTEKDELGSKDDEATGIEETDIDAVETRPKRDRTPEYSRDDMNVDDLSLGAEIDVSSRSGSMIIHDDEDDSEVQTDVAEAVKQTLAAYRPSRIRALNEELEASAFHDNDESSCSGSMIIHDEDDSEVQSDVSEAVEQSLAGHTAAPTSSLNEGFEIHALHMEHAKVGLDEVEKKRRYSSEHIDTEDNYLINKSYDTITNQQIDHDNESEEEVVEEQLEAFDNPLNETVIDAHSNEFDESINETFEKESNQNVNKINEDNELKEQNVNVCADDQSDLSEGDKTVSEETVEHISASKLVSDTVKLLLSEVLELIYWRDVKKTGVVFGTMLFILLSLTCFTILSVAAYLSLAILTVTLSFRVYKNVMQAVQKTNEGHPFKKLLAVEIALSEDVVQNAAEKIAGNMNNCCKELRRLFLVEDYVDSLKFGLLLWLMTYIGSWFNGMTLVILAVVCIFTLPKVYETYQGPIDQNVNLVRAQLNNIMTQVSSKIPFPKKKAKTQ